MASESPDSTAVGPMPVGVHRLPPTFGASSIGSSIGVLAQRSTVFSQGLGLSGLQRFALHPGSSSSMSHVRMPAGVWPTEQADELHPAFADPGMAAIARMYLRQPTSKRPVAPRRGLPQVSRRAARTASGANTGPSSLARRLQPAELRVRHNESHGASTDAAAQQRPSAPLGAPSHISPARPASATVHRTPSSAAGSSNPPAVTKEVLQSAQAYARADTPDAAAAAFAAAMGTAARQQAAPETSTFRPPHSSAGTVSRSPRSAMWAAVAGRESGFDEPEATSLTPTDAPPSDNATPARVSPASKVANQVAARAAKGSAGPGPATVARSRGAGPASPGASTVPGVARPTPTAVGRSTPRQGTRFSEGPSSELSPNGPTVGYPAISANPPQPGGHRGGLPVLRSIGRAVSTVAVAEPLAPQVGSLARLSTESIGVSSLPASIAQRSPRGRVALADRAESESERVFDAPDAARFRSPMTRAISTPASSPVSAVRPPDPDRAAPVIAALGLRSAAFRRATPASATIAAVSDDVSPDGAATHRALAHRATPHRATTNSAEPTQVSRLAESQQAAVQPARVLSVGVQPTGLQAVSAQRARSIIQRRGVSVAAASMWMAATRPQSVVPRAAIPFDDGGWPSRAAGPAGALHALPHAARSASTAGLFAAESRLGAAPAGGDGDVVSQPARLEPRPPSPNLASPNLASPRSTVRRQVATRIPPRPTPASVLTPLVARHAAMVITRRASPAAASAGALPVSLGARSVAHPAHPDQFQSDTRQSDTGQTDTVRRRAAAVSDEFPAVSADAHPEAVAMQDRFLETLARHGTPRPVALPERFRPLARALTSRPIVIAHDASSRAALRSVNRPAATLGNVVHLQRAPDDSAQSMELLAHELVHAAAAPARPRFFDEPGHDHEEHRARSIGQVARRAVAQRIDPASLPLSGGAVMAPRIVQRTSAPSATSPTPVAPSIADTVSSAPSQAAQRAADRVRGGTSGTVQRSPNVIRREPTDIGGADSELTTTQRLNQLDDLIELIERRVINELERRGGRVRGNW